MVTWLLHINKCGTWQCHQSVSVVVSKPHMVNAVVLPWLSADFQGAMSMPGKAQCQTVHSKTIIKIASHVVPGSIIPGASLKAMWIVLWICQHRNSWNTAESSGKQILITS